MDVVRTIDIIKESISNSKLKNSEIIKRTFDIKIKKNGVFAQTNGNKTWHVLCHLGTMARGLIEKKKMI